MSIDDSSRSSARRRNDQDFREGGWERNPVDVRNGGPCPTPRDWFTTRWRSVTIRNACVTSSPAGATAERPVLGVSATRWRAGPTHPTRSSSRGMSRCRTDLRAIDPFGHLITTSFWSKTGPEQYWGLTNIDIVQTHCYTNDDNNVAEAVRALPFASVGAVSQATHLRRVRHPQPRSTGRQGPPGLGHPNNSLGAGLTSFAAGGPMPWWHENYVDPLDLYFHFTTLSRFTHDLPLGSVRWTMLETTPPEIRRREPAAKTATP